LAQGRRSTGVPGGRNVPPTHGRHGLRGQAFQVARVAMTLGLLLLALPWAQGALGRGVQHPEEHVNTLGGTNSTAALSHGNVLPLVVRPWGMNAWAPDTSGTAGNSWWFHPDHRALYGVRCTHQPSPWIGDYGQFWVKPSVVDLDDLRGPSGASVRLGYADPPWAIFDPAEGAWSPYLWRAELYRGLASAPLEAGSADLTRNLTSREGALGSVELTSTSRGAALRLRFAPRRDGRRRLRRVTVEMSNPFFGGVNASVGTDGRPEVYGVTKENGGGVPQNCTGEGLTRKCENLFAHWFYLTVEAADGKRLPPGAITIRHIIDSRVVIDVDAAVADELLVRAATSFVSRQQAVVNHRREVDGRPFDELVAEAKAEWHRTLGRVDIADIGAGYTDDEEAGLLEVFYSSLYRAVQFPRLSHEVTEGGDIVHYSPYDPSGRVLPGYSCTDSGFWDAYRTVYPLLALAYPEQLGTILQGWLNAWREQGWLPTWASPGERGMMPSTMGDAVIADAIAKGIRGFNHTAAYQAIAQDAFTVPPSKKRDPFAAPQPSRGRAFLRAYLDSGYVPMEARDAGKNVATEVVSRTLDYMLTDNAIAHAAEALGKTEDAEALRERAAQYPKIFDQDLGYFLGRFRNGTFRNASNTSWQGEYSWGFDYTEGGPWQYRFSVPYDPQGLGDLYRSAGLDLCDTMEEMMLRPPFYQAYSGNSIIHEQTEMSDNCWGQYAHNNQPVHHVLYMFAAVAGNSTGPCAVRGQRWLRRAMTELYRPGPSMYSGDEDNGEMGAWFVLSALGLYELEPGSKAFAVGSPLFREASVRLPQGRTLRVSAEGNGRGSAFVTDVGWEQGDGSGRTAEFARLGKPEVPYASLMAGGTLRFVMGPRAPGPDSADLNGTVSFDADDFPRRPGGPGFAGALYLACGGLFCALAYSCMRLSPAPTPRRKFGGAGVSPDTAELELRTELMYS